jgi:hypothetical protein
MKTLFILIMSVVFIIGNLISPNDFRYPDIEEEQSTEVPAEATAAPNIENLYEDNDDSDVYITSARPLQPAFTPEAEPNSSVIVNPGRGASGTAPDVLFGEAKSTDNFERGSSGFGLSAGLNDDENIRIISLNNRLSLEPKKDNGWISWRLRPPSINDGAVEMEFSIVTCARGDRTGILMHSPDYSSGHGYYFSLSCEGTISIMRDSTVIDTADARGVFKNNSGDINVMAASIQGNELTVFLNDTNLLTVQDDTYPEGFSGFFVAPQGQNTLTMDILLFKEYYNSDVK